MTQTHYVFRWLEEIKNEVFPELRRESDLDFEEPTTEHDLDFNPFDNDGD